MQVPMRQMPKVIPSATTEVFQWLGARGIAPAGAPILRFHVIDMAGLMDIEMGVPVDEAVEGDDQVKAWVLPAGEYATLVYTGVKNGIAGTRALLDWAAEKGLKWDRWDDEKGDAFAARYETYLTDPADEPDTAKWETEIAIKIAD